MSELPEGSDHRGFEAEIRGFCHDDFVPVREAFAGNFAERGEVGAGVCVVVDGETVVDLVGGCTDADHTVAWSHETLVNVYSVGKAIVATLLLELVDDGRISLDTPIGDVWPEFAVAGKATATVLHALTHQAGVPAIRTRLSDDDLWVWESMTSALAATEAWFLPGSRVTYHTNTYGHLIGEIVRRVSGEMPGARLTALAGRLDADVWCGLPSTEHARCADVIWAPTIDMDIDPFTIDGDARLPMLGYFNPPGYSSRGVVNTAAWRSAQVPSTNMHASARGIAHFYDGLIRRDVLSEDLLTEATKVQAAGPCPVLGEDVAFGLGFVPTSTRRPLGRSPRAFGHFGTGGALGCADPDAGVAFGYTMNHVIPRWQSSRNRALLDSLYDCLD